LLDKNFGGPSLYELKEKEGQKRETVGNKSGFIGKGIGRVSVGCHCRWSLLDFGRDGQKSEGSGDQAPGQQMTTARRSVESAEL
jgi:hypothetical protein